MNCGKIGWLNRNWK